MKVVGALLAASLAGCATHAEAPRAATSTSAPSELTCPADATLLRGARVFDGTRIWSRADVLFGADRIAAIDTEVSCKGPVTIVDARGATVLPGFIDASVRAGSEQAPLATALRFGVTTVIDMFGPPDRLKSVRARDEAGTHVAEADLRGAGILVTSPGGRGTEYGIAIPTLDGAAGAEAFVDARLAEGSDFIDVVIDTEDEGAHQTSLDEPTVAAVVTAAHQRGRRVVAEIGTRKDAEDAVRAHVDGLAHLFHDEVIPSSMVGELERRQVYVIPTLSMMEMGCGIPAGRDLAADPRVAPRIGPEERKNLARARRVDKPSGGAPEACMGNVFASLRALDGRAPLLVGTDAPSPGTAFGASFHEELRIMVRGGLSTVSTLRAATSAAAAAFQLWDRGRIAPNVRADLVVVDGDPTTSIGDSLSIRAVYARGVSVPLGR